ncbi:transposase [bacterium]|nr:transposase [bacterium]MBU1487053.1 transposase [bacterium]
MKKIRIIFVNKDFSRFATFPLIGSFLIDFLKLDKRLQILSAKRRKIVFSKVDYCLTLISCILLGIKNLNNIDDCLQTEGKLAELIGIKARVFPKRTACRDFLTFCTHWMVKQIDRINLDLLREHSLLHRKKSLIVDIDQTTKSTEGVKIEGAKPGFNTKHKGRPSLKYSLSLVCNYIFSKRLESGNTHCLTNFKNIYNDTRNKISQIQGLSDKPIILRIDGGYFSKETLGFIDKEQVKFITKARINLVSIKNLIKANKDNWQSLNERVNYLYFKDQRVYPDWLVSYNILVINEKQKRLKSRNRQTYHTVKEIRYALITNLDYPLRETMELLQGASDHRELF